MTVPPEASWAVSVDPTCFAPAPLPVSPVSTSATASSSPLSMTFASPGRKEQPPAASRPRNRSRKQHVKTPSAPPCPPHEKEVSTEDDWTRVKCPKEKKRIQNRVAQRTYRKSLAAVESGSLARRVHLFAGEERKRVKGGKGERGEVGFVGGVQAELTRCLPQVTG